MAPRIVERVKIRLPDPYDLKAADELVPLWEGFTLQHPTIGDPLVVAGKEVLNSGSGLKLVQAAQRRLHSRAQAWEVASARREFPPQITDWYRDLTVEQKPAHERTGHNHRPLCLRQPGCSCLVASNSRRRSS